MTDQLMHSTAEQMEALAAGLEMSGGGQCAISYDPKHPDEWTVMVAFGKEAEDSDMVGGLAIGTGTNAAQAMEMALNEANWFRLLGQG